MITISHTFQFKITLKFFQKSDNDLWPGVNNITSINISFFFLQTICLTLLSGSRSIMSCAKLDVGRVRTQTFTFFERPFIFSKTEKLTALYFM